MCGRFTLRTPHTKLLEQFGVDFRPRYNIAPSQKVLILRGGQRELVEMRWAFATARGPMINAKAETVARLPSFSDAFHKRRCLVPADGFYEWQKNGKQKQPFFIGMKDGRGFALAGIWQDDAFAILTTEPNELVAPIHNRMPVILDPADYDRWLDPETPRDQLPVLGPYRADQMQAIPISSRVNSVANDDANCLQSVTPERLLF